MQTFRQQRKCSGLTLVETMMYVAVAAILAYIIYSFVTSSMILYAKNMSIVRSHNNIRTIMDRTLNNMMVADSLPVLINTTAATTTSPAAGLYFDTYLGDPYVVTNPAGAGLPSGTTTLTITSSTAALASPPKPNPGDSLLINNPAGNVRAQIATCVAGTANAALQQQPYTVTLTTPLAAAISWPSNQIRTATLVHRVAFIVMPAGNVSQLQYYPNFEPIPTAAQLAAPANYVVISNQLSAQSGETTPFTVATIGSDTIVNASFYVRSTDFSTYLSNKQSYEFDTFVKLNTSLASRLRPAE
jgi:hypothetical protein